ncbi:E3 ubiquitin-protein ligase RZFP34-like isoform X2 [Lycium ferocissimum]|uniref:E3 ubiquitin-protein ligase RZFP34-like isoform X2 n=1 Tax=Lycium ferocissimum TaxID=112874 RepID=UPI0028152119|nr:E3 ubiquitin-protein ligase RZFP34-like isoform X2 [Lycium ferocissimum]
METGLHEQEFSHSLVGDESKTEMGSGDYGRRCKIIAPCCDEIFDCRHCHNDSKNSLEVDPLKRHDVPRHDIKRVICSLCNTEQDVQQTCSHCGVCMGKYYCSKCNFFDDDVSKDQYHCDKCGICRLELLILVLIFQFFGAFS